MLMMQTAERKILFEKKFNTHYVDKVKLYTVCFISRRYEGKVSIPDSMELLEARVWVMSATKNEGVTINGIRYVFDVRAKHGMCDLGFEFDPAQERNLAVKRCIVETVMEYDPTVRGSVLKEDAERSV